MFAQFFLQFFFFQTLASSIGSHHVVIPAHTEMTVQWRDITFVIPDTAFAEETTLTIRDRGALPDTHMPGLPDGYTSTQQMYAFLFSHQPAVSIPMTLALDTSDTSNKRRRIFYTPIDVTGERVWTRMKSRVHQAEFLIRTDVTQDAGRVVVGTHKKNKEAPVKLAEFSDFGALPYSDTGIVIDNKSGKVLYAQHPDKQRSIASLSKLLTTVVCLEQNPNLSESISYSSSYNTGGASMSVYDGDTFTLQNALFGALVPSANNMAMTVAHSCGLSYTDFMNAVNAYALTHHGDRTHLDEPTGLDSDNVSTARNIARIARRIFRTHAETYEAAADFSTYTFTTQNTQRTVSEETTNLFDGKGIYEVVAFKTGYLPGSAERTVVLKVRKIATEQTIIVTLLGNPEYQTIFSEAYSLVDWTFNNWVFHNYAS
ncbi:MAG: serine hydrolase [Candidatus Kerfeldbacteria bacterium]|nr:serine hydrolase [Candidatus Kerfeldbacteria bacterium]